MTDPRLGDDLLSAIQRLPVRSGVIFRHYDLNDSERLKLFAQVRRTCARRGHMLLIGGLDHGRHAGAVSAPVHDLRELAEVKRLGIPLLFISPVYATGTHPGARPLGLSRFKQLAARAKPAKVIALGGMTRNRARSLEKQLVHGWAGIDAFGKKPR
jgi:thiamine-phosphate pyrophosphorylase